MPSLDQEGEGFCSRFSQSPPRKKVEEAVALRVIELLGSAIPEGVGVREDHVGPFTDKDVARAFNNVVNDLTRKVRDGMAIHAITEANARQRYERHL